DRANEKCDVIRQSAFENGAELLQGLEDIDGFSFYIVGKKIRAFEPDQLATSEEWECLQRRDGRTNRSGRTIHIAGRAINDLESDFTRLGRRELFGQLSGVPFCPR